MMEDREYVTPVYVSDVDRYIKRLEETVIALVEENNRMREAHSEQLLEQIKNGERNLTRFVMQLVADKKLRGESEDRI